MGYGSRKYGHSKQATPLPSSNSALPTFVCNRCGKIQQFTAKTVTLTGVLDNAIFLTSRICETCGKLLQGWLKGK